MAYKDSIKPMPDAFLKSISIIHLALLAGQVLFGLAVFAQSKRIYFGVRDMDDKFILIVPLVAIGGFITGYLLFKKQLIALRDKSSLGEKIIGYQTALIVRFALLEAPSLFAIVAYQLNGNLFYLGVSGLLMLYFLFLRPTREKLDRDLDTNFNEQIGFLNEDDVIK